MSESEGIGGFAEGWTLGGSPVKDPEHLEWGIETAISMFRATVERDLSARELDGLRVAVTFAIGYGVGAAHRLR